MSNGPVFVDCRPEIAPYLTPATRALVPAMTVYEGAPADEADLIHRLAGRRFAMVYLAYLSEAVLAACPDLRTVVYLSSGLATRADLAAVARRGIDLTGVRGYGDRAVAEHAIALMFAALRHVALMDRHARAGGFPTVLGHECAGATFGVVGLGGIGCETAKIAHALGMRVLGWGRRGVPEGVPATAATLPALLAQSDVVSLHLRLEDGTRGLLNAAHLALMRPGAVLVNTARAALVDEAALLAALRGGGLGHAALDVFHEEPPPPGHPLLALDNVTLSTHSAWYTPQAVTRLLDAGYRQMRAKLEGARG